MAIRYETGFEDEKGMFPEKCVAEGDVLSLSAEVCRLIEIIYRKMKEKNEGGAEFFKFAMIMSLEAGRMFMTDEEQMEELRKEELEEGEEDGYQS